MQCPRCQQGNSPEARFCSACGSALGDTPSAGERRQLTVLFCDLVGSTARSGQLDPEDWREVVRAYQQAADEVVARYARNRESCGRDADRYAGPYSAHCPA